jgi:hypothetical protein
MKSLFNSAYHFAFGPKAFPFFLLGLCLIAYAPLITQLGFYWDDFPINWIASTMGSDGLTRYFSTNRPVWGLIYKLTTPIFGSDPLAWQIFGLVMRWVTGLALWALLRQVWREREYFAAWTASLFVVYPGFSQQSGAFMYSHFYIVLTCLLLSLYLMILAHRRPRFYWPLTIVSALLGLLNLLAMEYFFLLDLLRPVLLWIVLSKRFPDWKHRLQHALLAWTPYLIVFCGALYWRSVLFGFQTYQPILLSRLRSQPLPTLLELTITVLSDVWKTSGGAWIQAFASPLTAQLGERYALRYWIIAAAAGLYAAGYWLFFRPNNQSRKTTRPFRNWAWQPIAVGVLALFIAGGPFWLTDLKIGLAFPGDRFTLPFMLGASLLTAGLLAWLPLPRWSKSIFLALLLGMAVGLHFQHSVTYNWDWQAQRRMFWQIVWRMPDLQPGTTLLANELPVLHYTDNSLSAPLNWIYNRQENERVMDYMLFYPTLRKSTYLNDYQPNHSFTHNYLAATFYGSNSQLVAFYYNPPACLRVLDPEIEHANWMVPNSLRETLSIASLSPILAAAPEGKTLPVPPEAIFGTEISRGWCYYYEKADLARQMGDWETVARLGDEAFALNDYPNDPAERLPFIEGYAHTGSWEQSAALSRETRAITPLMQPVLCLLWDRIERETLPGEERDQTIQTIRAELECGNP